MAEAQVEARGRRRGTSRHRSVSRYAIPRPVGRAAEVLTPVLSLLPAVVVLVVVQALSPVAQKVPSGSARFDLAGAWLATEPGAIAGTTSWLTEPTLGRLQLGWLLHALQGGQAQSVLAAAHGAMLLIAVVQAVLLWWVLRRLGAGGVAAGLATAVFGIAPIAVATHAAVSATAIAVCWLLVAVALGLGARAARVGGGLAAVVAVASAPSLTVPAMALGALLVLRLRRTVRGGGLVRRTVPTSLGVSVGIVVLGAVMAITAALPASAATARLDALAAAQGATPTVGLAALGAWSRTDLLSLLVVLGSVVLTAFVARDRAVVLVLVLLAAMSIWPQGTDEVVPLVVLLPVAAGAIARSVDAGVGALGHPLFIRSVLGSAWLTGVGAVLVVAVIGWLVGLSGLERGRDLPVAQVERWIDTSVPAGQTVLVGLGAYPDLVGTTKADVGWYGGAPGSTAVPSSMPWSRADYVVEDTTLPADRTGAAAGVLGRSLEIAAFGSGAARMSVWAVRRPDTATTPPAPTTAAGRAALAERRRVGTQLAQNPRIEVGGTDRARLLAGDVDTRIAIVLAQFVTAHSITISGFGVASGDASGIRTTVTISEIDGRKVPSDGTKTGVLLRFLSDLRGAYATSSIDATDGGITAAFTPSPDFVPGG